MTKIASLTMYDLPEVQAATDAWWMVIATHLSAAGVRDVPSVLTRGRSVHELWRDPGLLLTQTCGYPLTHEHADDLTAVAVPSYAAEGCGDGTYRSGFVVRSGDPATTLADLRGRRVAANGADSQSGCSALRAAVAPLARAGRFFGEVQWSGGHRFSLAAVREGRADVAAIDGVTLALIGAHAPAEMHGVRILDWSAEAPALPYATRRGTTSDLIDRLRDGVLAAARDPGAATVRDTLLLRGMDVIDDAAYTAIVTMRETAERLGYPVLA
ncbi:MAG: PhnD/SsuA/transferrin family substrate-binding protein [Alphaproteobacteria bacterium]|nr:PhnD/SsuA/transferrin family substrate-binding protein [Alphaproteobacteria bacterium]